MNYRTCLLFPGFIPEHLIFCLKYYNAVFFYLYDIRMCIPDHHLTPVILRCHHGIDRDLGSDMIHNHFHQTVAHHLRRFLIIFRCDICQRFQSFFRICRYRPKCRRIIVAESLRIRNSTGKCILVHTGIQCHMYIYNLTFRIFLRTCHGKCDSSRLGHAKCRFHIFSDQLRQLLHILPPPRYQPCSTKLTFLS